MGAAMTDKKKQGPVPVLSHVVCQTCPAKLSVAQVAHGMRRCKACRSEQPLVAKPPTLSPWVGLTREQHSAYVAAKELERRKGSQSFAYPSEGP